MGKRLHKELEEAFSSANTKYPSLDDIIRGIEDKHERKSRVEEHLLSISKEMEEDSSSEEFSNAVESYVKKKFAAALKRYKIIL